MYQKGNNHFRILALFLADYTKQLYLREISRMAKIPLKTVQRVISYLEESKILRSSIRGKNKYFWLNLDNIQLKFYLLQSEIYKTQLFLEKYPQFKTFVKGLGHTPIIVFGSFSKFTAEKDSDVDLLIISDEKVPLHLLPYNIHEVRLSEKSFEKSLEKQETLLKEIEKNHIILSNHSFYIDTLWGHYAR